MLDPRIAEIEFLSYLEQERPSSVAYWDWEKKGVPRDFFTAMVFDLFCDDCLDGQSSVAKLAPTHMNIPAPPPPPLRQLARGPIDIAVSSLLTNSNFQAHINHRGRLRLWRLRDEVQKARTKEKFGILWDRRHWDADVAIQLAMRPKDSSSGVLFMDLDNFKPVNDRCGHDVGDDVLKIFFQTVTKLVGTAGGEAYGWGGDEVVVIFPNTSKGQVQALEDAIRTTVASECSTHPKLVEGKLQISVSIGGHIFADRPSAGEIVKAADEAMYADKRRRKQERKEGATP